MKSQLVVGIDSSTTTTKAIAWDHDGHKIAEGTGPIRLFTPAPDYYEQDSEDWWNSMVEALRKLLQNIDNNRITAISIANQRETFVGLDKYGKPVRPAIIWLDERCKGNVDRFASDIGENFIHQVTGKPKDYAPVVYRLAWMLENERDLYKSVSRFCDVQSYLVYRLTGNYKTSWASADPLGILDLEKKEWAGDILSRLEITPGNLPEIYSPGVVLGIITKAAACATGLKEGTKVVAGGGDGQAAGLGVNALRSERAYLNLGTAVVSGTYSRKYRTYRSFRTMSSCDGVGYYYETSLRSGTFLLDWFIRNVLKINPAGNKSIYSLLEEEARQVEAGCQGLMILPYWNAVMNPYWDPGARGCMIGLSSRHHRGHLYRALLEGIAMEQSLATQAVEQATGDKTEEYAVIGGGAKSDLWCQIIADISGTKIVRMVSDEASSLGAGITAAVAAGWFRSFEDAANNMVRPDRVILPNSGFSDQYRELLLKYRQIYPAIRDIR